MKMTNILLISLVLLSTLGTAVVVDAVPHSRGTPAAQTPITPAREVLRGGVANPGFSRTIARSTNITLTTNNPTPHVRQTFALSGAYSISDCSWPGFAALELYRSVNGGEYRLFCTITTQADGTFSKNVMCNTPATLKYYAVKDESEGLFGSRSNTVTVTIINTT